MKQFDGDIGLGGLIKAFPGRIAITWFIVLIENALIALIPLIIGLTIDGLLAGRIDELIAMTETLVVLGGIAVGRRWYDTRVYGTIRLRLGAAVDDRNPTINVFARNARLDMSRELVDFLEEEVPN